VCSIPELGGGYSLFFFEEGRELSGILKFELIGDFRDIQRRAGK